MARTNPKALPPGDGDACQLVMSLKAVVAPTEVLETAARYLAPVLVLVPPPLPSSMLPFR